MKGKWRKQVMKEARKYWEDTKERSIHAGEV